LLEARDTTFDRFGRCRPTRVLGLHATPLPLGGKVPPGRHHPAPGSYSRIRHYLSDLSIERRTTFLSSFPIRFPSVQAFTSRCSTLRRPCDWLGSSPKPYPLVCILPLSTLARQCCLAAIHPKSRPEGLDLIPGIPTLSTFLGPLLPSLRPRLLRPGGLHSAYRFLRTA